MVQEVTCAQRASDAIREIQAVGYAVIPSAFPNAGQLKSLVEGIWAQDQSGNLQLHEDRAQDRIVYNLQDKDYRFIELLSLPVVVGIARHFLNDPYYQVMSSDNPNYILNYFNARSSGQKLDLHIDSKIPFQGSHIFAMQFAFVLDHSNELNGCTVVVPGSHNSGSYSDRECQTRVPLAAEPGDLVIWDSRLWHGALEGSVSDTRWIIIATLTQWWVKQSVDMTKALPQDIYDKCSADERTLLGFLSIPPSSADRRVITKQAHSDLKSLVSDYR